MMIDDQNEKENAIESFHYNSTACGRDPQTSKACGGPKELSTDIFALCPLQDPQEVYLCPR